MKMVRTILAFVAVSLLGTLLVPGIRADEENKKTVIMFSQPFEIPGGKVLPAGTYTFQLLDTINNRNVVEIFNADGTQIIATILAINNYRMVPTGETVIKFAERPGDQPDALKAWFYPGNSWGQEFVYPKRRAIQLAASAKEPVPALTTDTFPAADELKTAPIVAITPQKRQVPVATVIQIYPLDAQNRTPAAVTQTAQAEQLPNQTATAQTQQLPKTASLLPLMALLGVASLGFAFVLKRIAG